MQIGWLGEKLCKKTKGGVFSEHTVLASTAPEPIMRKHDVIHKTGSIIRYRNATRGPSQDHRLHSHNAAHQTCEHAHVRSDRQRHIHKHGYPHPPSPRPSAMRGAVPPLLWSTSILGLISSLPPQFLRPSTAHVQYLTCNTCTCYYRHLQASPVSISTTAAYLVISNWSMIAGYVYVTYVSMLFVISITRQWGLATLPKCLPWRIHWKCDY